MSERHLPQTPSGLVPREALHGWRPWQAASLHSSGERAQPDESDLPQPDAAAQEAERLAQVAAAAHEQAYAEGYAQGHGEGRAAGHEEGYARGHDEGYAAGFAEGQKAAAAQADTLAALAQSASTNLATLDTEISAALTRLAVTIAQQVTQVELQQRPETIVPLVRQVLQVAPTNGGLLYIHLHPDDAELASTHLGQRLGEERWRLVPDAAIQPGGCFVRTTLGEVDATLQTRWRRVLDALQRSAPEVNK